MFSGPSIQNGMDPQNTELQKLQNKIQKQEHNLKSLRTVSNEIRHTETLSTTEGIQKVIP